MNSRVLIALGVRTAPSLLSAQKPAEMSSFKAEKCYGIAKAGKNDCACYSCWPRGGALSIDHLIARRIGLRHE